MSDKKKSYIQSLFKDAKSRRERHEAKIRECYYYIDPDRDFDRQYEGDSSGQLFDRSAATRVRTLITNTMRLLIPQNVPFAEITYRSKRLKQLLEGRLKDRVMRSNERLHRHFLDSNFHMTTIEILYDAVVAGTMAIAFSDESGKSLGYQAVPLNELYFLEDHNGSVRTIFREHEMDAHQLESRFDAELLPEKVRECIQEKPTEKFKLLECVIPKGPNDYLYEIYLSKTWEQIGESFTSPMNPFVVSRWSKSRGRVWGRSQVQDTIEDIRVVNQIKGGTLTHGAFAAQGLWQVEDETMNVDNISGNLQPGQIVAIDKPLVPVPFPGNFGLNFEMTDRINEHIKQALFDTTLEATDARFMKAEAVIQLRQQFFQQVGEPASRLQREYLQPIAEQAVLRLQHRGELAIVSMDEIEEINQEHGLDLKSQNDIFRVDVNAALTRSMAAQDAQDSATAIQNVGAIFTQVPEAIQVHVKTEKVIPDLLRGFGLRSEFINTEAEARKKQEEINQLKQALAALEQATGQKIEPEG